MSSSSKAHIVLDALLVNTRPTGVGRSILELVTALADRQTQYDFTVLTTTPAMFDMIKGRSNWRLVDCPGARGGHLRKSLYTQFRLPLLVRDLGADILHSLQFVSPLWGSTPTVVTVHDLTYCLFPKTIESARLAYYKVIVPKALKRAEAIVTNSQSTCRDVQALFPKVGDKVTITPFGTPSWALEHAGQPTSNVHKPPFFLFVGTLEPRKNLRGILAAYETYLNAVRDMGQSLETTADLQIIGGPGWQDKGLNNLLNSPRFEGRVRVHDHCAPDVLWTFYKSALALLFPSLHEGFGFPILEAMAAGLPVITSNRGAMAEVAGSAAILVDPQNRDDLARHMMDLSMDINLRKRLSDKGVEHVGAWSWQTTAEATLAVYDRVLKRLGSETLPPAEKY